eukprot:CAMPEP_0174321326 /NCGR_PEP_ID=MMETSP0810-20121108/10206_1 /TAXON_ID=73025 ORGANISM="Eutreptiella gymnastica-like, Strain CCMP1594" /NCGR_SAMPLE_ID=MMETSP0810 /ASSEMBLY_ACC=CAM_ASM_000659 /LENGTH=116 /DNA_ID=CAMNT_0015432663 /DNA_START=218 /DNA_END=568 /DNA_ORIENTATION=+
MTQRYKPCSTKHSITDSNTHQGMGDMPTMPCELALGAFHSAPHPPLRSLAHPEEGRGGGGGGEGTSILPHLVGTGMWGFEGVLWLSHQIVLVPWMANAIAKGDNMTAAVSPVRSEP